jgi:hypothetical protein
MNVDDSRSRCFVGRNIPTMLSRDQILGMRERVHHPAARANRSNGSRSRARSASRLAATPRWWRQAS